MRTYNKVAGTAKGFVCRISLRMRIVPCVRMATCSSLRCILALGENKKVHYFNSQEND